MEFDSFIISGKVGNDKLNQMIRNIIQGLPLEILQSISQSVWWQIDNC